MSGVRGFFKGTYRCHFEHQHTCLEEVDQCNAIRRNQIEKEKQAQLAQIKMDKKVALEKQRTRQMEAHAMSRKADCYQHAVQNSGFGGGYPGTYLQIEGPPGNYQMGGPPGNYQMGGPPENYHPMPGGSKGPGQMELNWVDDDSSDEEEYHGGSRFTHQYPQW